VASHCYGGGVDMVGNAGFDSAGLSYEKFRWRNADLRYIYNTEAVYRTDYGRI
jgi:hypothetical protein